MILRITIIAFILKKAKNFIDRQHWQEHRRRHKKWHLKWLWKRHRFLRRIAKRKKKSEIKKRLILKRITRRNLKRVLIKFRVFSFIEKKHAVHQIVDVYNHFFHDFCKIIQLCINFRWKFFSLLDDAQQIRRTITNIFLENRLYLFHKNRRLLRFVLDLFDFQNCVF